MKQLSFKGYSTREWQEFKRIHHERFWEELYKKALKDAKAMMQSQIYEEFDMQIGAGWHQRTDTRQDKRNGFRYRSYEILGGYIEELKIPRSRKLDIRFTVFDMWERVQSRVLNAMVTAYLLGKSSTTAQDIIEAFGQSRFSRSYLQRLVRNFEQRLKRYRNRQITQAWPYIFIDGMAVKVYDVYLKDKIVIFALGMDNLHNTEILGWIITDTEDEASVRSLLIDLKQRGLQVPDLFISDDSGGIRAALRLEYPHTPWQLCCFHKIENINRHLIDIKNRKHILREAGDIYQLSDNKKDAIRRFRSFRNNWYKKEPEAMRLFSQGFEDTLSYFEFPKDMWVSIRTNDPLEQFIGKLRAWLAKFNYFQGKTNLELAIYTYFCYKNRELVPEADYAADFQKDTLLVA
jgi:transposase-like protein